MPKLNAKQQALLNGIKTATTEGFQKMEIFQAELQTAKSLERKGFIRLEETEIKGRKVCEATLVDLRVEGKALKAIEEIQDLVDKLQAACKALSEEHDPNVLLNHMGEVLDKGRIETLRRALQERALEGFEKQGKI